VEENNRKGQNVARGEVLKLPLNNIVMEKRWVGLYTGGGKYATGT